MISSSSMFMIAALAGSLKPAGIVRGTYKQKGEAFSLRLIMKTPGMVPRLANSFGKVAKGSN